MRCHICNKILEPEAIRENRDHEDFDPCGTCLAVINEVFEPFDEEEVTGLLQEEWGLYAIEEESSTEEEED